MINQKMNISKSYSLYIINGKVYLYYEDTKFNDITFDESKNLIRIGYDTTTECSDKYLIEINNKTRHASLKTYPKITLTQILQEYNANDNYNKIYPYYGKNTTIIDKKEVFISNKNIYPKYFKLNKTKYVIDTKIKYDCNANIITESILSEIYSIVFHLRFILIQKDYDDFFDELNKIELLEYNIGESLFHNGYYGPVKKTIKLYDENYDNDYDINNDNENDDENDDDNYTEIDDSCESNESNFSNDEFMPDIIKLNLNLTNKILELENKINTLSININNKNNNIEYKINENMNMIKYHKNILYVYFLFFIMISIWFNFL